MSERVLYLRVEPNSSAIAAYDESQAGVVAQWRQMGFTVLKGTFTETESLPPLRGHQK